METMGVLVFFMETMGVLVFLLLLSMETMGVLVFVFVAVMGVLVFDVRWKRWVSLFSLSLFSLVVVVNNPASSSQ
jgi:hypothetical protein